MFNKVFISGPMRGLPNYNFPKFDAIEKLLKENGYDVVNPAHISRSYKESTILNNKDKFNEMVERQLTELRKCNLMLVLDGWENSAGVKVEIEEALKNGICITFEKPFIGSLMDMLKGK